MRAPQPVRFSTISLGSSGWRSGRTTSVWRCNVIAVRAPAGDTVAFDKFWRPDREEVRFARDSPLEEDGFELLGPPSKRTAVRRARPSFFAPGCTGCDRVT